MKAQTMLKVLLAHGILLAAGCIEQGVEIEPDGAMGDTQGDIPSNSETQDAFYSRPGALPQSASPCRQPVLVKGVVEVIDGDTLWVDMESGPHEKVRLLGVDTPEISHGGTPGECFAQRSKEYTRSQLTADRFWMSFDDECLDHYGRTLAYITTRDGFFQREQLESGFAVVMTVPPNDTFRIEFEQAQQRAKTAGAGLWSECY